MSTMPQPRLWSCLLMQTSLIPRLQSRLSRPCLVVIYFLYHWSRSPSRCIQSNGPYHQIRMHFNSCHSSSFPYMARMLEHYLSDVGPQVVKSLPRLCWSCKSLPLFIVVKHLPTNNSKEDKDKLLIWLVSFIPSFAATVMVVVVVIKAAQLHH